MVRVIRQLLKARWRTAAQMGELLGRPADKLVEQYLGPMTKRGELERLHAEPNHPEQAYRATELDLQTRHGGKMSDE